jgi:glycerophosphoryl diester phosphodiesterase
MCHTDPECTSALVVSHRIAPLFAPENSLAGLRAAILLGIDVAESDIRQTADGHVVLLHDPTVDRTTDGVGAVASLTLAELQALRLEGMSAHAPGNFECERVPTLAEAAALAEGSIALELDVKVVTAGVAAAEYIRDHDLYETVYLRCDPGECAAIRAAVADAPIMTVPSPGEETGSTDLAPPPLVARVAPDLVDEATLASLKAQGIKSSRSVLEDADLVALGGDPSVYLSLYEAGIDMLLTEHPHLVLHVLGDSRD